MFQIVMEEDESESNVELHEKMTGNGTSLSTKTLGITANSQRAFEAEREYKVSIRIRRPGRSFFKAPLPS